MSECLCLCQQVVHFVEYSIEVHSIAAVNSIAVDRIVDHSIHVDDKDRSIPADGMASRTALRLDRRG